MLFRIWIRNSALRSPVMAFLSPSRQFLECCKFDHDNFLLFRSQSVIHNNLHIQISGVEKFCAVKLTSTAFSEIIYFLPFITSLSLWCHPRQTRLLFRIIFSIFMKFAPKTFGMCSTVFCIFEKRVVSIFRWIRQRGRKVTKKWDKFHVQKLLSL
jgi:hypothetical protein